MRKNLKYLTKVVFLKGFQYLNLAACLVVFPVCFQSMAFSSSFIRPSDEYLSMAKYNFLRMSPYQIRTLLSTGEVTVGGDDYESNLLLVSAFKCKPSPDLKTETETEISPSTFKHSVLNGISEARPFDDLSSSPLEFIFEKGIIFRYVILVPFYASEDYLTITVVPNDQRYYKKPLNYDVLNRIEKEEKYYLNDPFSDNPGTGAFSLDTLDEFMRSKPSHIQDGKGRLWKVEEIRLFKKSRKPEIVSYMGLKKTISPDKNILAMTIRFSNVLNRSETVSVRLSHEF